MKNGEVHLGPLRLQASDSWTFYPFGNLVLGRPDSRFGNLQITLAFANDVPADADPSLCLTILQQFMETPQFGIDEARCLSQTDALFGEATLQDAKAFRRYWYRLKNGKLVLAVYQCAITKLPEAGKELEQAAAIAATMEMIVA